MRLTITTVLAAILTACSVTSTGPDRSAEDPSVQRSEATPTLGPASPPAETDPPSPSPSPSPFPWPSPTPAAFTDPPECLRLLDQVELVQRDVEELDRAVRALNNGSADPAAVSAAGQRLTRSVEDADTFDCLAAATVYDVLKGGAATWS